MKKLLFVIDDMGSGGGEKSLSTLLQLIDKKEYSIDLLVFFPRGLFMKAIPPEVNLIDPGEEHKIFFQPLAKSLFTFLRLLKFDLMFARICYTALSLVSQKPTRVQNQLKWKYLKKCFASFERKYDAAIGYLEGDPNFFVADCVNAKVKIGYIHCDYAQLGVDTEIDKKFFEKLDRVVGVSDECVEILKKTFSDMTEKFIKIENITSPKTLEKMSQEIPAEFEEKTNTKNILTIGRIAAPKGYDIAIDAAEILSKKGYDFKWFSIGKGELYDELLQKVKEKNLEEKFVFLGERANPYPYLANCDIYVQPSYSEGKSIAVDEAKILARPIVATKFSTVYDQLIDGETALLADIDAASVAEKIEQLFDENLAKKLSENLKKIKLGNEEEIEKFYAILGEKK